MPKTTTTVTIRPLDERGIEILDALDANTTPAFRWNLTTGQRSYSLNAAGAPSDGYEAVLTRIAPDWRAHLTPPLQA